MKFKEVTIKTLIVEYDVPEEDVPCNGCTKCCEDTVPFLTEEEIASGKYIYSLYDAKDVFNRPFFAIPKIDGQGCMYFRDKKCQIYSTRPTACRQFDCRKGYNKNYRDFVIQKFGIDFEESENEQESY